MRSMSAGGETEKPFRAHTWVMLSGSILFVVAGAVGSIVVIPATLAPLNEKKSYSLKGTIG